MRKNTSTNSLNKQQLEASCGMAHFISAVGGRWKLSILGFLLDGGQLRFSDLRRKLNGISEKVLDAKLKDLQNDGLVIRIAYPEVPPRVEYRLTEKGQSLREILMAMSEWGSMVATGQSDQLFNHGT
jgi:DNA-binding HxlR family transcriptional regulator